MADVFPGLSVVILFCKYFQGKIAKKRDDERLREEKLLTVGAGKVTAEQSLRLYKDKDIREARQKVAHVNYRLLVRREAYSLF
jgi:hypothetical protein